MQEPLIAIGWRVVAKSLPASGAWLLYKAHFLTRDGLLLPGGDAACTATFSECANSDRPCARLYDQNWHMFYGNKVLPDPLRNTSLPWFGLECEHPREVIG